MAKAKMNKAEDDQQPYAPYAVDFHAANPDPTDTETIIGFTVIILAPDAATARLWAAGFVCGAYTMRREIVGCIKLSIPLPGPGFFSPQLI
jgi:hypothetical protein